MQDVSYNDTPQNAGDRATSSGRSIRGRVRAGDGSTRALTRPRQGSRERRRLELGRRERSPPSAIDVGYVSYRISRVTAEGTVYTIGPRLIMPGGTVADAGAADQTILDDDPNAGEHSRREFTRE